jgi:lipoprotein-anchoring transpeptidase ErfK/SrfK
LSEKVYALDLMSCRARGPTLGAAMALLIALVLGGCMQAMLNPVWDANFTARDKQQLANPPYQQAWIPPAYQRPVVQYHRKDAPGSILVDTDGGYVYYVLPEGRAIRYGAIMGENGQAWSQGRMAGMDADRG